MGAAPSAGSVAAAAAAAGSVTQNRSDSCKPAQQANSQRREESSGMDDCTSRRDLITMSTVTRVPDRAPCAAHTQSHNSKSRADVTGIPQRRPALAPVGG